ncbi:integrase catalytic domain-containing protein [Trichonephila clavipes]|nr:integrase catalytic domain-containing protein [Trichonephila clavipes]
MAFLGRSRKEDLRMWTTELGLAPSGNLKIIKLKDLITNSDRYDEEFIKNMLSVIVEERSATEKQKAAELEEKQKAAVMAQQREREFEHEKMKIQLEMQKLSQAPVTRRLIKELKITTFDQLKSLIIADQIKRKTPANIKEHFLDIWADLNDPLELAEKLNAYDNLRHFKKKEGRIQETLSIKEKASCWRIP